MYWDRWYGQPFCWGTVKAICEVQLADADDRARNILLPGWEIMIRIISRFNQADLGTVSQRSVLFTHSTHWQLPCIHLRSRRETVFWYPYLKHQRNAYEGNFHVTINVTKSSQLVRKHVFSQKMKPSRGAGRHCTICLKEIEAGELPSVQLGQHCVMACIPAEGRDQR